MSKLSYTQLSTFEFCPFSYKLRYIDLIRLEPDNTDPANPLIVGSALHKGIEEGVEAGLELYDSCYPLETDKHVEEKIKLENFISKVLLLLPPGKRQFEFKFSVDDFEGYIDLLVKDTDGAFELYDFKYSSNAEKYKTSPQIHLYRLALETLFPKIRISKMGYIMVPKIGIRPRKDESQELFRRRLYDRCAESQPFILEVPYDEQLAKDSLEKIKTLPTLNDYPKTENKNACRFCEYAPYCNSGDLELLPPRQRRHIERSDHLKVYLYGGPYVGKTTMANTFPDPLFFNTDGNYNSFDAPYIPVRDEVIGAIKEKAWDKFNADVKELLATPDYGGYKTVVIDLVDGLYEHCRTAVYDKLHITHESDKNLIAWDVVRSEFYRPINALCSSNLNVVLISHEDTSRDIMGRNGGKVTAIKPNIHEKVAIRLSSMVDMTVRLVDENGLKFLSFKTDNVQFGGCRIKNPPAKLPATYQALKAWIDSVPQMSNINQAAPQTQTPVQPGFQQGAQVQPVVNMYRN